MSMINALDLLFFVFESPERPLHMAAYYVFDTPEDYDGDYAADLVASYRDGPVVDPFNRVARHINIGVARWYTVEPDMDYHVRHIALPKPGTMDQLRDTVTTLNASMLDRSRPLWEIHVIEGIEGDRVAVLSKIHHSLMDGLAGLRLFERTLSTDPGNRAFKSVAEALSEARSRKREKPGGIGQLLPGIQKTAKSWLDAGLQLKDFKPWNMLMPFSAERTSLNAPLRSGTRRFGSCDLSLDVVANVGKARGATVNDVVMTCIDAGLQQYLEELGESPGKPLRAMMPVSLENRSGGSKGGNKVGIVLVELGAPAASPAQRLDMVMASTGRTKEEAAKIPASMLQVYASLLNVGAVLTEKLPAMDRVPSNNLLVSNMPGPREPLYQAGAPMVGFYGLPIVPPGCGLNITFLSYAGKICLAIGANPDAIADPQRLAGYIESALADLQQAVRPKKKKARGRKKKKTAAKRKTKINGSKQE